MQVKNNAHNEREGVLRLSPSGLRARNKRLFTALLISSALIGILLIRAGYNYHLSAGEELLHGMEAYASAESMLARAREITASQKRLSERVKRLEQGLLKAAQAPVGSAELEEVLKSLASKARVAVKAQKALPPIEKGQYVLIPVEFQMRTDTAGLKELLFSLQSAPVMIGVKSLSIRTASEKDSRLLDISLVIEGAIKRTGA